MSENLIELMNIDHMPSSGMIKTQKQDLLVHQVFLDEDIGEPSKYRELISSLYGASEIDTFNIFINSGGGSAASALAITEAIIASQATVRAILNGDCHSAASIIALSCHEIVVTDSATMLIHTASFGAGGNTHNIKGYVDFTSKQVNKTLDKFYKDFLSEHEMIEAKKGVDLWIDSDSIIERLDARKEKFDAENAKPEKKKKKK